MRTWRILAIATVVWVAGYLAVYLLIIDREGDEPAWWYVALLAVALALLGLGALTGSRHGELAAAAILLGLATVVAIMTIGLLLVPALAAAVVAVARSPRPHPVRS